MIVSDLVPATVMAVETSMPAVKSALPARRGVSGFALRRRTLGVLEMENKILKRVRRLFWPGLSIVMRGLRFVDSRLHRASSVPGTGA
jgi:hypothetical protein